VHETLQLACDVVVIDLGSNSLLSHPKDFKSWYSQLPCLTFSIAKDEFLDIFESGDWIFLNVTGYRTWNLQ